MVKKSKAIVSEEAKQVKWVEEFKKLPDEVQESLSKMEVESSYKIKLRDLFYLYMEIVQTHHIIRKISNKDKKQQQLALLEIERRHFGYIDGITRGDDKEKEVCQRCLKFLNCKLRKKNEAFKSDPIIQCKQYEEKYKLETTSLTDVHKKFQKWLPTFDTTRIDTRLAWYLANEYSISNPLWVVEIARSGLTKSETNKSMSGVPKLIELQDLTDHTFISVKTESGKPVKDFGSELHNRNRCIIMSESASLKSMNSQTSAAIFSQFKNLHDGFISKKGGSGISKEYENCNTSVWINSTPDFRNHFLISQIMGTCYIIDCISDDMKQDEKAVDDAIKNMPNKKQMEQELNDVVKRFLAHHKLRKIEINDDEKKWINKLVNRLKILRAQGVWDDYRNELAGDVSPEFPPRMAEVFLKLYISLLSLDEHYDRDRAKIIVERMIDGSGEPVMVKILNLLDEEWRKQKSPTELDFGDKVPYLFSTVDIRKKLALGTGTIKKRLEVLANLGYLSLVDKKLTPKGGPPGFVYTFNSDITTEQWNNLFSKTSTKKQD